VSPQVPQYSECRYQCSRRPSEHDLATSSFYKEIVMGKVERDKMETEITDFGRVHYPFRPICQYGCLGTPSSYPKWYAEPAGAASKRKNIDDDCNFGRRNLEMRSEIAPEKAMKDVLQRNPALFPTRLRIRTVTPSDASPRFLGLCGLRRRGCISGP
jgi:hypothetical protein